MKTEHNMIAKLYREACADEGAMPAQADVRDLVDLAQGRLAGERRQQLVEAIAGSPSLAAAYRMAKVSGDWAQVLAADLAETGGVGRGVRVMPRPAGRTVARRHPFALAAAVSAMAVGAVFVGQQLRQQDDAGLAAAPEALRGDAIAVASFDAAGSEDRIFSSRMVDEDGIFGEGFGKGS